MNIEEQFYYHSNIINDINNTYKKWRRFHNVSRVLRIIAWIVSFLIGIAGLVYAINKNENFLDVVLYSVAAFLVSTAMFGVLILLLKPILALIRKEEIKVHSKLTELETEFFNFGVDQINSQINEYGISDEALLALRQYVDYEEEYYNSIARIRELKTEKARICEWKWVKSAIFSLILVIALVIAFMLFAVVLVISIIILAISSPYSDRYSDDYSNDYIDNDESLISLTVKSIYNSDKDIKDELTEINRRLKMILNNQKFAVQQVRESGFAASKIEAPAHLEDEKKKIKLPKCECCFESKPLMIRILNDKKVYMCEECRMKHKGF